MTPSPQLSERAITEFMAIYERAFGQGLTPAEAEEMALRVLRIFALLIN